MSFVSLNYINYPMQTMEKRWTEEILLSVSVARFQCRILIIFFLGKFFSSFSRLCFLFRRFFFIARGMKTKEKRPNELRPSTCPNVFLTKQISNQNWMICWKSAKSITKHEDLIYFVSLLFCSRVLMLSQSRAQNALVSIRRILVPHWTGSKVNTIAFCVTFFLA